jgi:hypothetical protein
MTTYVSPFTGDIVQPTDVSYYSLTFGTNQELVWPNYAVPGSTTVAAARVMDCMATASGLKIFLPDAMQGSVGTDILFRNKGANTFSVVDSTGANAVNIAAGESKYFYLTDNSTAAGTWSNVAFGTGTSSADAASLVGNGLINLAGRLETSTDVIAVSSAPTFNEDSRALAYVWTSGAGTFNLPNPATISNGWFIMVRNGGTGALTIDPYSTQTIDGNSSLIFYPSDSATIVYDETTGNFFTVGLARQTALTYTAATYDVDSIPGSTFSLVTYAPNIQTYDAFSGTRTTNLTVELPAITQLYVVNNQTGSSAYDIIMQISGSLGTTVTVSNNTSVLLLSDGTNLSILSSQSAAGSYLANNGTLGAPAFSFTSDSTTGMYLVGNKHLGLASNNQLMLSVNASNLSNLQVSTPAQFNAALIAGGSF